MIKKKNETKLVDLPEPIEPLLIDQWFLNFQAALVPIKYKGIP